MQELLEQIVDYLKGIWIKRRYIIIATWAICPIGWYLVAQMPNVYESSARVYVDTQSLLRPLLRGLTVETNPDTQIRLMVRTLLSRPNLERISRMTDLDVQASTTEEYDKIIENLKKDLKISNAGRENIFTLSIEDKNADAAKNIVQAALTVFIENTLGETRNDSDEAQKFLNAQIRDYENRLVAAETRLTNFKQKYGDVLMSNSGGFYATLNSEEEQLERAQLQLEEAKTRLASAKAQLAGEEPVFGLFASRVKSNNSVATTYDSRIEQLERSMDEKLLRFTEKHPEVLEIQRRLDELIQLRTKEIEAYYSSIKTSEEDTNKAVTSVDKNPVYQELKIQANQYENEVASLTVRVENFKQRVTVIANKIHSLPEVEAELTALNRGYNITKAKYEELLARKETAQLAQQADETTDKIQFRVIDPPRAALQPSGPPRLLFFVGVTIFGIVAGLGISLLMSQISPVITSTQQLSRITGIPVFGTVSANESLGLHNWHRRKTILFMMSNLALIILLVGFISYFAFPDLVQTPLKGILG
ncbi:XrtA system polysaccharide chain length determinant [Thalassotalea euphylliae]|uniref:Chain length determinant family protein n=1 Tax=Thalassotalea euphylliae TaxID=1655234 RepID=A0A3E0U350_9GAMM|nr:XrtA system polysaccharide chain length determinant [Thalassotalea euphylliae]REL31150.1 chain length determinant family protein [Thalassotalea euphylliae]